jgi:hypothetical protein
MTVRQANAEKSKPHRYLQIADLYNIDFRIANPEKQRQDSRLECLIYVRCGKDRGGTPQPWHYMY